MPIRSGSFVSAGSLTRYTAPVARRSEEAISAPDALPPSKEGPPLADDVKTLAVDAASEADAGEVATNDDLELGGPHSA